MEIDLSGVQFGLKSYPWFAVASTISNQISLNSVQ